MVENRVKNLDLLFDKNPLKGTKMKVYKNAIHYINYSDKFNSATIRSIIRFVNSVRSKYRAKIPIYFEFPNHNLEIRDKLVYVMFECICYSLKLEKRRVYVFWKPKNIIHVQGVYSSPLHLLNSENGVTNDKFVKQFKKDIFQRHFRKLITEQDLESNYLGVLLQELTIFLKMFDLSKSRIDRICSVIVELVGNAGEHARSECLIDIDVTEDHYKKDDDGQYYAINIVILSFSNILLGDEIKEKVLNTRFGTERYTDLRLAYRNHESMFGNSSSPYKEEHFWDIAALQDKISGRKDNSPTGGTGLTVLINSLQKEAENNLCYVMSGDKLIIFKKELIKYDKQMWLGFNKENDFFNYPPDNSALTSSKVWIPGTAYNLNFVMKKEEEQ